MKKKVIIPLVVVIITLSFGYYLYSKPHKNVADIKASLSVSAKSLCETYEKDEASANKIFLGKVIEVKGKVIAISRTDSTANVTLEGCLPTGDINCSFTFSDNKSFQLPDKNSLLTIKGRCAGFLVDVNLVDCVVE